MPCTRVYLTWQRSTTWAVQRSGCPLQTLQSCISASGHKSRCDWLLFACHSQHQRGISGAPVACTSLNIFTLLVPLSNTPARCAFSTHLYTPQPPGPPGSACACAGLLLWAARPSPAGAGAGSRHVHHGHSNQQARGPATRGSRHRLRRRAGVGGRRAPRHLVSSRLL